MKNILADSPLRPRGGLGAFTGHPAQFALCAAALAIALATGCSGGDDEAVSTAGLDCTSLAKDYPYHYRSAVTFDLAERPPGAPPEQPHDYGPAQVKFTREFEGTVQAADRREALVHQDNAIDLTVRVVGNQAWTRVSSDSSGAPGGWQLTPLETAGEIFTLERICEVIAPDLSVEGTTAEPESVNGADALRYTFRSVPSQLPSQLYGPESDFAQLITALDVDLWLAKNNNHPVRITVQGTGHYENSRALSLSISSEITGVKDDSVKIDPP